ncbi:hypothetical protein TRFO_20336 [Tritrichomonas foetus]|uniref:UDENN domain-containing protein n=1 Tax=Tritrichomonas foetus TaxID=1144522 RepID=A0A1J4KL10_9EUKA|nr:hypothetical protein TRFO_20336 [Tritrichomonas foetus]|eukprot:OHT10382.1 hypothetical protein TRFO_20336 [Tritrichomonas foetus]
MVKTFYKSRMFPTKTVDDSQNCSDSIHSSCDSSEMFDRFFIFGGSYDQNSISQSPSLLVAYPSTGNQETNEELNQIAKFCYPNGFSKLSPSRSPSNALITEKFVFFLKKGGQRTYGCCIHFNVPEGKCPFFANNLNRNYPFCFCFISKVPCISLHIRFAVNLVHVLLGLSQPHQNVPKFSTSSVRGLCYSDLTLDKNCMAIAVRKGMRAPKCLIGELLYYQNLKCQTVSASQSLLYPTIHTLFSYLSVPNIILIYTAVLLERKVLLVSKSISKYSSAAIALTALCEPFNSVPVVIPVVPPEFSVLLDSPIPYIAGSSEYSNNADIVIDLDTGVVHENSEIPKLPAQVGLLKNLNSLIEYEKENIIVPPKKIKSFLGKEQQNPQFTKLVKSISDEAFPICKLDTLKMAFKCQTTDMIKLLFDGHFLPQLLAVATSMNGVKDINKNLNKTILICVKSCDKIFFEEFASTQGGSSFFIKDKGEIDDVVKMFL